MRSLRDLSVERWLEQIASEAPAPGGGAVAALAVAQAAALAGMAGRFSVGRPGLDTIVVEDLIAAADRLRDLGAVLADADAAVYEDYLAAVRMPREPDPASRSAAIAEARSAAADVPLQTAEAAADVARLALAVLDHGNPGLRSDAAASAFLAAAAATVGAMMVTDNLAKQTDDPRVAEAVALARTVRGAADDALARFPALAAGLGS
jgi:methenyltetrahydrofolate cyclohydrolase